MTSKLLGRSLHLQPFVFLNLMMRWHPKPCLSALRSWTWIGLLLWPVASVTGKTAADYYVSSMPGQPDGPLLNMHAGHIEVTPEHHGNLFFWHFENRHIANRRRTVIWLNGGPGCSSMDGALMEIGPYRLKDSAHLVYNEGSWDEFANLLFVDNPVGTGYSYVDTDSYVHELKEMADQLIIFLEKFFDLFPEHEDNDIYIAGESYAGQHIPYLAQAILDHNASGARRKTWNLLGLIIGNGWISPLEQYHAYSEYAFAAGLIKPGSNEAKQLEPTQQKCVQALNATGGTDHVSISACEDILVEILRLSQKNNRCVNMYDVRLDDTYPSCGMKWPPDLEYVTPYLRRQDVIEALHVSKGKQSGWTECGGAAGANFDASKSKPSITMLPSLLEKMPMILFSGDKDLICNHLGTEEFIHNMEWNGGKGFELSPGTWAPRRDWTFEGEPAGFYQEARNLTYIVFYNSSHMVPFDYPRRTRDMLDRFLNVDIASIGGKPSDSRIDGEQGLQTSVGGHSNSTTAEQAQQTKLAAAKWAAYYKSGEVALVVVIILASAWGWYVWRDRRRRTGYRGLFGGSGSNGLQFFRDNMGVAGAGRHVGGDVETADFDESELDELNVVGGEEGEGDYEGKYGLGGGLDGDDEDDRPGGVNGTANEKTNGHAEK